MIADSGSWTLETLIWLPLAGVLTIVIAGLAVLAGRWAKHEKGKRHGDRGPALFAMWAMIAVAALVPALTALGMYPYKAEYHQWRTVDGAVAKIDHRLIGTGDGMEDKFVVRFEGSSQQYGCDDTRCAGVEAGDNLSLSCKRAWQYTGTDGYDCRFVATDPR